MKKSRIGLLIVSLAAIAGVLFWRFGTQQKPTPIPVTLGKVETTDILRKVTASGTLEAADVETLAISPLRRVKTVKAAEGETVRKGQVLAEMDVSDLELQRQKLLLAGAQIEADLKELATPTLTAALHRGQSTGLPVGTGSRQHKTKACRSRSKTGKRSNLV